MKKIFILPLLLLLTGCVNIQLVQEKSQATNALLPITTEETGKDMSGGGTQIPDTETTPESDNITSTEVTLPEADYSFRITQTWPLDQSKDVVLDKPIEIYFNKDVKQETLNASNITMEINEPIHYYEGDPFKFVLFNFDPDLNLLVINSGAYDLYGETIIIRLTENITTVFNEPLTPYNFSFQIKPPENLPPFYVVSTDPNNNDTFVTYDPNVGIRISYSNEVDQTTINDKSVTITLPYSYTYAATEPVSFNVRIDYAKQSSFLTLDPEKRYEGETIKIELNDQIKDIYKQQLPPYSFEFTLQK